MAGLLDDTDDASMLRMALATGLLSGGFAGGAKGLQEALGAMQARKDKKGLLDVQIEGERARTDNYKSEAEKRRAEIAQEQAARERDARLQTLIPSLYRQDRMTGGEAQPQTMGGVPMFSQPMQAAPMRQERGGFDVQGAIRAGMPAKMIQEYAALENIGRPEVARTYDTKDDQGRPITVREDKFGNRIGEGLAQWKAPIGVPQGDRHTFVDPVSLTQRGSLPINMSPSERDASARGWAGNNIAQQRLQMDQKIADGGKWQYDADRGGRVNLITGAFEPVTQGGQAIGPKDKPLTESQAKAAAFLGQMKSASETLAAVEKASGVNRSNLGTQLDVTMASTVGNMAASPAAQQMRQSQEQWAEAWLRFKTGAAATEGEVVRNVKTYFPQINDDPPVIAQKAQMRAQAERDIAAAASGRTSGGVQWKYVNGKLVKVE